MRISSGLLAVTVTGVVGLAGIAEAAFVSPSSWTRGVGGTTYQEWDVFTDDNGASALIVDSTPDVGLVNPNGTPTLTETTGTPFLTSGGNIYSPATATAFSVTIPEADVFAPPHNVTAIVQFRTLGTELDYANIRLNGLAATDSAELYRETITGGFGGAVVDTWLLFNIAYASFGNGDGLPDVLTLTFNAAGTSMSLDRLAIDTAIRPFGFYNEPNPVPEPAAALSLLAMSVAMLRRR